MTRLITLLAYTALPLVGVLLLDWDWREIVLLYWLENISIGVAMVIKLLRSAHAPGGNDPAAVGTVTVNGQNMEGPAAGTFLAIFFSMHYGIFTFVHGVFVLLLIGGIMAPVESETPLNWWGVLLVWAVGGAAQVFAAIRGPLPRARGTLLMFSAYPRIIVLHLTVILGVFAIIALQWGPAAAILLIALHALIDGAGWMFSAARDHLASRASATAPLPASEARPQP